MVQNTINTYYKCPREPYIPSLLARLQELTLHYFQLPVCISTVGYKMDDPGTQHIRVLLMNLTLARHNFRTIDNIQKLML